MVIEDFFNSAKKSKSHIEISSKATVFDPIQLARPLDRLAALIFDVVIVLFPLLFLIVSPLRQILLEARFILDESKMMLSGLAILFVVTTIVLLYFTLMTHFFGATLGKFLFSLRVCDLWHERRPDFTQSFVRAFVVIFELALFYLPTLTIFTNSRRRTWHDRLSDTVVISASKRASASPGVHESSIVKGFFAAIAVFVGLIVAYETYEFIEGLSDRQRVLSMLEENGELCSAVGEALSDYSLGEPSTETRLSTAMALFAAGAVSKSCLAQEVEYIVNRNEKMNSLSYLALAFVHSNESELSNSYLDKVCESDPESDSCLMSKVVVEWSDEKWDNVDHIFEVKTGVAENHLMVWAIRHYMKHGKFTEALDYIERLSPQVALSSFLTIQRAKALWGLGRETEARAVVAVAMDVLEPADRLDLAGWMCFEEVDRDCAGSQQLSCKVMNKAVTESSEFLLDPKVALTTLKKDECAGEKNLDKLSSLIPSDDGKKMIKALSLFNEHKTTLAIEEMQILSQDAEADDDYRLEAKKRLVLWSKNAEQLTPFMDEWKQSKVGFAWGKMGRALFRAYYDKGLHAEAKNIGEKLVSNQSYNQQILKDLIISLVKLGDKKMAWLQLNKYMEQFEGGWNSFRAPASADDFSMVVKTLSEEYLEK